MPENLPTIAIIGGTGNEGKGLALRWAAAGYKIYIGSRQKEKAEQTAEEMNNLIGAQAISGLMNFDAVRSGEICVLTVIHTAHQQALDSVKNYLPGKILVDATSRVDYRDPKPPEPPCAAQEAQLILGTEVKVVAAFQNVPAKLLLKNIGQVIDAEVLVCSDDISAAEQVIKLASAAGMRSYYAGILSNANVVEGLTSILISMNKYYKIKDASIKVVGVPEVR